jgi:hypothetical protein
MCKVSGMFVVILSFGMIGCDKLFFGDSGIGPTQVEVGGRTVFLNAHQNALWEIMLCGNDDSLDKCHSQQVGGGVLYNYNTEVVLEPNTEYRFRVEVGRNLDPGVQAEIDIQESPILAVSGGFVISVMFITPGFGDKSIIIWYNDYKKVATIPIKMK